MEISDVVALYDRGIISKDEARELGAIVVPVIIGKGQTLVGWNCPSGRCLCREEKS